MLGQAQVTLFSHQEEELSTSSACPPEPEEGLKQSCAFAASSQKSELKNGDFYEALDSDAELTADLLSLALTTRKENGADMPLTGFPVYKFKDYIETLLQAKYPVAIANADETLNYRIVETYVPAEQNVVVDTDVQALTQDDISIEQERNNDFVK